MTLGGIHGGLFVEDGRGEEFSLQYEEMSEGSLLATD